MYGDWRLRSKSASEGLAGREEPPVEGKLVTGGAEPFELVRIWPRWKWEGGGGGSYWLVMGLKAARGGCCECWRRGGGGLLGPLG